MKKILLLFSIILLCIVFTAFAKADFTITTNMETNIVCPSSTIVIEDIVTATTPGTISVITIGGTAGAFTTTVPQGFWLEQGQQGVVYSYITPSSKISPGNYVLEITLSQGSISKTVRHNIIVENCHNTVLKVEPVSQAICACEQKSFTLTLTNKGLYLENYEITAEGPAAAWINLSSKSITLAANSTATIIAYVLTPCNVAGNYDINFVVTSKSEYGKTNVKAGISIVSCYDYIISSEKTYYGICEAEKLTVPVKIKNLGTQDNIYTINMQGPNWTKIDVKRLSVEKGKEGTFNIIAEPPYKLQGNFTVYLEAMSEYGKVLKKHDISLQVSKCYDVSVKIYKDKDKMCNALSNTYAVAIKNTGKFKNTYDIILTAPEWVTINEKRLMLNASEEKELILDVHPPYNTKPGVYNITVKAVDAISKVEASDTINITTISLEECYQPAISTKDDIITVAKDNTATALFIIENKGLNDANYTIEISGTATKFSQINPGTITLKATKAQTVYLYVAPALDIATGDYVITVTVRLKDTTILASKTVTIRVVEIGAAEAAPQQPLPQPTPKAPAEEKEQSLFSKIISWIANLFKLRSETTTNATNQIKTNVTDKTKTITTNKTTTQNATNTTIQKPPVLNKNIPDRIIQPGKTDLINLAEYFSDPNNDDLTYVTVKPQNITITIEGSIVTIEPQQGFTGTRTVSFYASDGYSITQSNTFKIIVGTSTGNATNTTNQTTTNQTTGNQTNRTQQTNKTNTNQTNATTTKVTTTNNTNKINTTTEAEEEKGENKSINYISWIILGIIILVIIVIIATGLGKKIVDFFDEDISNGNDKKNNHKNKK